MKPKDYTYDLPGDYTMKPEHRIRLDKLVEQNKLTNEEAQEWIDLHVELVEQLVKDLRKALVPTVIFWAAVSIVVMVVFYSIIS